MDISILYFLTQADCTIIRHLTIIYAMTFLFPPAPLPKFNRNSFAVMKSSENHLLPKQTVALQSLLAWFGPDSATREQIALVSMPTGSGKTGVMACLPYFLGSIGLIDQPLPTGNPSYRFDKPILVIAPDLEIAKQLERQLSVSKEGSIDETFLVRRGIVPEDNIRDILPVAKKIESTSDLKDQHSLQMTGDLIIANAQKFLLPGWELELPDNMFRLVVVDEAHHHPAKTWRRIVQKFNSQAQVVFFTATPYRSDGKKVLEDTPLAYHLPLRDAVREGIIRKTNFEELEPINDLQHFEFRNRDIYDGKEIHDMGRMVTVLQRVKSLLDSKNKDQQLPGGVQHMAIAIAKNVNYANRLLDLWNAIYPNDTAETYYSEKAGYEKVSTMAKLKNNELRLVIVVAMLLEGFDHPPISIAAITCKISSGLKFAQFVGRAQRIYRGQEGTEENGQADIITHVEYEQRQRYVDLIKERLIPKDQ